MSCKKRRFQRLVWKSRRNELTENEKRNKLCFLR
jgi:hypothetical protein